MFTRRKENAVVNCEDVGIEDKSTDGSSSNSEITKERKMTRASPAAANESNRARNLLEQSERHRELPNARLCPD